MTPEKQKSKERWCYMVVAKSVPGGICPGYFTDVLAVCSSMKKANRMVEQEKNVPMRRNDDVYVTPMRLQ